MSATPGTDEATARKRWELENNIQHVELDEIFKFDEKAVSTLLDAHPWRDEFVHNSLRFLFLSFSLFLLSPVLDVHCCGIF